MSRQRLVFKIGDIENDSDRAAASKRSPLADLVRDHLQAQGIRQIDFCRRTGFDQGLLSKILSSVVNTLNVETALKLAEGMNVPARVVFEAIGKTEVDEMLRRFYSNTDPSGPVV
jgi:transcriptional regulator with XRE-family HTH domain